MVDAMVRELGLIDSKKGTLDDLLTGNHTLVSDALKVTDHSTEEASNHKVPDEA